MELEVGSTIGDYQVTGILGAGGMGKVYKVRNVISDRVEAMKVLLPDLAASPELADRFLREIKVLAMLDHPNIAQLHTAVRADNQLLMVMEFVDGETLEHRVRQGPLPIAQAVDYVTQVLSALEFAHSRGVVHRDIKPANIILTPTGIVKLMDFGIAKASTDHKLTMTGMTVGSVYYMSPEQIQGKTALDGRVDIYSLGITLYELVTGKRPFDGGSQYSIMAAHLEQAPAAPITLDPRLPHGLNDAILMAVEKNPDARFQTATAFRNAMLGVAAELKTPAAPAAAPAPAAPPVAAPQKAAAAVAMPQPVAAAVAARPPGKSKRWLWMSIGGIAAAAAIVCAIEFAPWKPTSAAVPASQPAAVQPAPVQPAPTPAPTDATPPAAAPQQATVPPPVSTPAPHPQQSPVVEPPVRRPPAAVTPAPQQSLQQQPLPQTPVQPAPTPAIQPPVVTPQPQPAAAPPGPSRAAVLQARQHFGKLQARAGSIHESLTNLQSQMQSQGLALNGKYTQPAGLMDNYLQSAENALNQSDLAAAKEFADLAERQIEKLEKLLNL
ncbi:MAG TPA: protein kinase [Bryobacteraceae bacterium]|jgi:serine/threonine-protein kinase|nr:protein kinase [Bryobacteraceae bacterium]